MPRTDHEAWNKTVCPAWQGQITSPGEAKSSYDMRRWNGSFSDFYHDGKPLPADAGVSAVTIEYFQNLYIMENIRHVSGRYLELHGISVCVFLIAYTGCL